jgi:hypothetical protein
MKLRLQSKKQRFKDQYSVGLYLHLGTIVNP